MTAQIVWLDGIGVDPGEVGDRAAALSCLRGQPNELAVPRSFVLGRSLLTEFSTAARRDATLHVPVKLPAEVQREIARALRSLGGSFAIRRSPLPGAEIPRGESWLTTTQGGRPERETYLNLTDPAEVSEAVRRIWGQGLLTSPPRPPVAIIVQRFLLPDVCAVVRRDRGDPDILHVLSTLGIGDLLAAGLVVPDRHSIRRRDGSILACSLGRKAQMTVAHRDGGLVRVPVPAHAARQLAIDESKLRDLHDTWSSAEKALPGLAALALSFCSGRWYVTGAEASRPDELEEVMLG